MSADMAVMVPSRGRPGNIVELIEAWRETSSGRADMFICVDNDDPAKSSYMGIKRPERVWLHIGPSLRLGGVLNLIGPSLANKYDIVGFMGDDHRPRTPGWDVEIEGAMRIEVAETMEGQRWPVGGAVVYGNDLFQGEGLPTAVFMDSRIVRTLGHFVLPGQKHLWMDNYWKTLGEQLGTLRYLPDVIIEHMHPHAGKGVMDEHYERNNAADVWENDERIYKEWVATQMPTDIARVKAALL